MKKQFKRAGAEVKGKTVHKSKTVGVKKKVSSSKESLVRKKKIPTSAKSGGRSSLLDRLKKKAVETQRRKEEREESKFSRVNFFKPQRGKSTLRILPHWADPDDSFFFVPKAVHYLPMKKNDGSGVFNAPMKCQAIDFDNPEAETDISKCPACMMRKRALRAYDKADGKKQKIVLKRIADDLRVTERYLYNVIDYDDDSPAIKVWATPRSVHEVVMGYVPDLDSEFWDLKNGRDWRLTKKVDPKRGAFGVSYTILPGINETAVARDLRESMKEDMADLDAVWEENGLEEMKKSLKLIKLPGSKAADEEEDEEIEDEEIEDEEIEDEEEAEEEAEEEEAEEEEADVEFEDDELEEELAGLGVG